MYKICYFLIVFFGNVSYLVHRFKRISSSITEHGGRSPSKTVFQVSNWKKIFSQLEKLIIAVGYFFMATGKNGFQYRLLGIRNDINQEKV